MEQSPFWKANRFSASQEIPAFYGTRRFITAVTSASHLSLSRASSIQSIPPHPSSWKSIYTWVSQVVSFTQVSPQTPCIINPLTVWNMTIYSYTGPLECDALWLSVNVTIISEQLAAVSSVTFSEDRGTKYLKHFLDLTNKSLGSTPQDIQISIITI
jgi:hypothetical protein